MLFAIPSLNKANPLRLDGVSLRALYLIACVLSGAGFCYTVAVAALREYTFNGSIAVGALLVFLGLSLCTATRNVLCSSALLSFALAGLDRADAFKVQLTNNHLQVSDALMAWIMLKNADATLLVQYWDVARHVLFLASVTFCVGSAAFLLERRLDVLRSYRSLRRRISISALGIGVLLGCLVLNGNYMALVATFKPYERITEPGGLRVGAAVDSVRKYIRIRSDLAAEARDVAATGPGSPTSPPVAASCENCPDLVIVHLESTFDPSILPEFADGPGYLERMTRESPIQAVSGHLLVNVFGGGSWISEFEVLCGVNHRLFDEGGLFPHMYLAPVLTGCFPEHLKRLGYETHAVYTTHPFFAGVGAGFRGYGIDGFADPKAIGAPRDWRDQRDMHFVRALGEILRTPSARPRFVFVSTNSNHGPHGDGSERPAFEGPFHPAQALNPALRDYLNRLNDTYTTMLALEHEIQESGRRVAVLFYGDHQPAFTRPLRKVVPGVGRTRLDSVTLYRMVRTYGAPPSENWPILKLEDVSGEFFEFAGVPLPATTVKLRAIEAQACPTGETDCSADVKKVMRRLFLVRS